jgi:hypothetical protein
MYAREANSSLHLLDLRIVLFPRKILKSSFFL